jgi:archaellin
MQFSDERSQWAAMVILKTSLSLQPQTKTTKTKTDTQEASSTYLCVPTQGVEDLQRRVREV